MKSSTATTAGNYTVHKSKPSTYTKIRLFKNLVAISISCFMSFSAYDGLNVLQSTLNRQDGIRVISVSLQYGCGCLTSLLFPKYAIKKFGSKSVIAVTSATYVIYMAANLYPQWYWLVPASVIVGLANSLFWVAQCQYLNVLSNMYVFRQEIGDGFAVNSVSYDSCYQNYSETLDECDVLQLNKLSRYETFQKDEHETKDTGIYNKIHTRKRSNSDISYIRTNKYCDVQECSNSPNKIENCNYLPSNKTEKYLEGLESTTSRIFGIHGFIFQMNHIFSNLLNYYILKENSSDGIYTPNSTCLCGAVFCNVETDCFRRNLQDPDDQIRMILIGTFVVLSALAVLVVCLLVDELEGEREEVFLSCDVLLASFKHMKNKYEILLTPFVLIIGIAQGLVLGDFTKAYIGCAWGIHRVGLVMLSFGVCLSLSCTVSGYLVRYVGRQPVFVTAVMALFGAGLTMLLWKPNGGDTVMFFVIAGLFGAGMGVIWSQIRAFYGVLFRDDAEVAFGNYNVFFSVGSAVSFGYSNFLCTATKIYIFLAVSIIGCIGYLAAERIYSKEKSIK